MIKVVDLFAGCGGFSTGFQKAGYEIFKAVEFDKQIAATYSRNHPNTKLLIDDIGNVDNNEYFFKGEAEVIIGGPPCQGFSMAGARIRGNSFVDDSRNYLFKHYVNIVGIVRPKVFILENVKGLLTMNDGGIFNEIVKTFSNPANFGGDKYHIYSRVIKAVEFGIPQKRERVVIIGIKNRQVDMDSLFAETKQTILRDIPSFFDSMTVWDAISDLGSPTKTGIVCSNNGSEAICNHNASRHTAKAMLRMKQVQNGQNWTALNEDINSVHSGSYGRLAKDDVSATITTRFDTPSGGRFIHPVEDRTLTPREAARIQSFSDDFVFEGTKSSICKQIGNAVPPKLSYFFAKLVDKILT
jgi:DNA (cytosine-5)-methyltransferase 1